MKSKEENRNYPRSPSEIELTYFSKNSLKKISGYTKDFSATGASFPVVEILKMGEMINLEFYIAELQKTIKTSATIMRNWIENNEQFVSVQFFDIDYHDFIVLLDYSLTYHIEK